MIDRVTDVHLGSFAQRRRPGNAVLLSQNGFKKNFKREQSTGLAISSNPLILLYLEKMSQIKNDNLRGCVITS